MRQEFAQCCGWGAQTEVVRELVEKKADVNARTNLGGTPLYKAVEKGRADLLCILLSAGVIFMPLSAFARGVRQGSSCLVSRVIGNRSRHRGD